MRLCREQIRVLTTLPPPPPTIPPTPLSPPPPHPTHSRKTMLQSCLDVCYMKYKCILFLPYADLFYMHVIHMHTFFSRTQTRSHVKHMYIFFSSSPSCSTRHTYAYRFQPYIDLFCMLYICLNFFSHTPTCSTRHTYAYLFQPVAEVKEGVAGVCERCFRCSYPQVFTVQQHVQMSVCVHPHPDNTARSDIT